MVQLSVVPASKRERSRRKRRQQFLAVGAELVSELGLGALTMQALADGCDCAIGTAYTYFRSKAELVEALEANAVDTLRRSQLSGRATVEAYLEQHDLDEATGALVRLLSFGGFMAAASLSFPNEVVLLQVVMGAGVGAGALERPASGAAMVRSFLAEPTSLLELAAGVGAVGRADAAERATLWLAGLNGVLLTDALAAEDPLAFRPAHLARRLSSDLLLAWGADPAQLARAANHTERLAALGPLAPPVDPVDV